MCTYELTIDQIFDRITVVEFLTLWRLGRRPSLRPVFHVNVDTSQRTSSECACVVFLPYVDVECLYFSLSVYLARII